jgi:hypothetical protein
MKYLSIIFIFLFTCSSSTIDIKKDMLMDDLNYIKQMNKESTDFIKDIKECVKGNIKDIERFDLDKNIDTALEYLEQLSYIIRNINEENINTKIFKLRDLAVELNGIIKFQYIISCLKER